MSSNEKKTKKIQKKNKIEQDKKKLHDETTEFNQFNYLLNTQLKINREKFLLVAEFLDDCIDDVKNMDEMICRVDRNERRAILFSNIDLDSLSHKRNIYKKDIEVYKKYLKESSILEKELYQQIEINVAYFLNI